MDLGVRPCRNHSIQEFRKLDLWTFGYHREVLYISPLSQENHENGRGQERTGKERD